MRRSRITCPISIVKDMASVATRTFFQDLNLGYKAKSPKISGLSKKMLVTFLPKDKDNLLKTIQLIKISQTVERCQKHHYPTKMLNTRGFNTLQLAHTGVSNKGVLNKGDKNKPKLDLAFFLLVLVLHSYLPKSSAETSYLPSDLPDASATAF